MPCDPEPPLPTNASWAGDWECDDAGVCRYYREADVYPGVYVFGYQKWDGTERGRGVYLGGDGRELSSIADARAYGLAVLEAADRL